MRKKCGGRWSFRVVKWFFDSFVRHSRRPLPINHYNFLVNFLLTQLLLSRLWIFVRSLDCRTQSKAEHHTAPHDEYISARICHLHTVPVRGWLGHLPKIYFCGNSCFQFIFLLYFAVDKFSLLTEVVIKSLSFVHSAQRREI